MKLYQENASYQENGSDIFYFKMEDIIQVGQKFPKLRKLTLYNNSSYEYMSINEWDKEELMEIINTHFKKSTEICIDVIQLKTDRTLENFRIDRKPYLNAVLKVKRMQKTYFNGFGDIVCEPEDQTLSSEITSNHSLPVPNTFFGLK